MIAVVSFVGLTCLIGLVLAGVFTWRSVPGAISTAASTRETPPGAVATIEAFGEVPAELSSLPAEAGPAGGGLTDPELKLLVWSTITSFYDNVRGCSDVSSSRIGVSRDPDTTGSWQETWEVVACGEAAKLKILFTVASDGGIFYDIVE